MNIEEYKKCVTNIRILCASMIEKAKSGHPGSCLGMAPILLRMYENLKYDPENPKNPDRDVFVISNAHACAILYVFNALIGRIPVSELAKFRQLGSLTPGHPEKNDYGVEITSEPLGQGVAEAVGFAIAQKRLGLKNKVVCIFGDGCYQEGISQEAFSIASNLNLNNLIFIYDSNKMTIDGPTDLSMNENIKDRFSALNFVVDEIHSEDQLEDENFSREIFQTANTPKIIIFNSVIGAGSIKAGTNEVHGNTIGRAEIDRLKGLIQTSDDFDVLPELKSHFEKLNFKNKAILAGEKQSICECASICGPNIRSGCENTECNCKLFDDPLEILSQNVNVDFSDIKHGKKALPTREIFKNAMQKVPNFSRLIVSSADLSDNVGVKRSNERIFSRNDRNGNFIHFGIREHGMVAALNGLSAFGFVCMGSTYLNFVTYCYPALRLSALDSARVILALSHDSIGVGEDGPTHQPIEALALLRATPNLHVLRPCDEVEVHFSLQYSLSRNGPTCIALSRQPVEPISLTNFSECSKGAYFLLKKDSADLTILASGSEVPLCLEVCSELEKNGFNANLVSFLSFEIFENQENSYKKSILEGKTVSVEMLSTFGWGKYSDFQIGVDEFGKSGKKNDVLKHFGFTVENITEKILGFLKDKND